MTAPRASLFRHPDFRRLWAADAVSQTGTAVTLVALPLVAIGTLHAGPAQVGLLVTFEYLAFLLIGLPAGAWVDRARPRRVMLAGDLGRAAMLGSVPVAGALGVLTLPQLYLVAFGLSVCTVFFDVAYGSYLPVLVPDEQLVAGNVALEVTRNVAGVGGPGLGGLVVATVTAPFAVAVDAVSYLASAAFLSRIRLPDVRPEPVAGARLWPEIRAGLRFVFGHPLLRAITVTGAISNLAGVLGSSMLLVLLAGQLRLSPGLCGLVFSAEAVGGILGALVAERTTARLGQGRAMWVSMLVSSVLWLAAVPLFQADARLVGALVLHFLGWVVFMTFKISAVGFRQRVCPPELLGRMTATVRFVMWGAMPVGALLGGLLGHTFGARPAMWAGAVLELLAVLPVLLSPLRGMRDLPSTPGPQPAAPVAAESVGSPR
ncbi:MFS transporter [Longispora sp. K20-0274]|uniref:MFS transporter n=1 Tax=Longispora sp. K20-0274 TaxID=3088255 RepID=UPI003999CAD6